MSGIVGTLENVIDRKREARRRKIIATNRSLMRKEKEEFDKI